MGSNKRKKGLRWFGEIMMGLGDFWCLYQQVTDNGKRNVNAKKERGYLFGDLMGAKRETC